jgi:hypothetical protein
MAHFVLACDRGGPAGDGRRRALEQSAGLLRPPGVTPAPTKLIDHGGLSLAVVNPNEGVSLHGASLCLGTILDTPGEWWRSGSAPPDGSFALIRCSDDEIELVADIAASRAVWYYRDDDVFLASSSQRALVALLGGFELEPARPRGGHPIGTRRAHDSVE